MHGRASNYRNIKAVNLTLLGRTHARTQQVPEAYIHDIQVEQDWNAIRTNAKFDQIVASQIFPRNQLLKMDLMLSLPFQHFTELTQEVHEVQWEI